MLLRNVITTTPHPFEAFQLHQHPVVHVEEVHVCGQEHHLILSNAY